MFYNKRIELLEKKIAWLEGAGYARLSESIIEINNSVDNLNRLARVMGYELKKIPAIDTYKIGWCKIKK